MLSIASNYTSPPPPPLSLSSTLRFFYSWKNAILSTKCDRQSRMSKSDKSCLYLFLYFSHFTFTTSNETIGTWILKKKISHLQARIDKVMPLRNNCWACLLTVKPKIKKIERRMSTPWQFQSPWPIKEHVSTTLSSSEHLIFSNIIYLLSSLDDFGGGGGNSGEEMMWNILRKCSISTRKKKFNAIRLHLSAGDKFYLIFSYFYYTLRRRVVFWRVSQISQTQAHHS